MDFNPWDRADYQQQYQEAERLAYIFDLLDRVRYHKSTAEDVEFLTRELTPNSTYKEP